VGWAVAPILARCLEIFRIARKFQPDVIYSGHFYCNLYAAITGRLVARLSIGSLRNDGVHEVQRNGKWGAALLQAADASLLIRSKPVGMR
jgi:hypothetical protein